MQPQGRENDEQKIQQEKWTDERMEGTIEGSVDDQKEPNSRQTAFRDNIEQPGAAAQFLGIVFGAFYLSKGKKFVGHYDDDEDAKRREQLPIFGRPDKEGANDPAHENGEQRSEQDVNTETFTAQQGFAEGRGFAMKIGH